VKKTPVQGRVKKTPVEGQVMTPVGGGVKKADPFSRQGRRTMTSAPSSVKMWSEVIEGLDTKTDRTND
jgi:hypothetical protein